MPEPEEQVQEEESQETQETQDEETPPTAEADESWRNELPENMRSLPQDQLGSVLNTMWQTIQSQKEALDSMRRGAPSHAQEEPKKPSPLEGKDIKDALWDNPRETIKALFEEEYGPLVTQLRAGSGMAAWIDARSRFNGFKDREPRVRALIKERGFDPDTAPSSLIQDAFEVVVGREALKGGKSSKPPTSEKPTPNRKEKDTKKKHEFENDTEKAIFASSGLTEDEYFALRDDEPLEVDVPLG